MGAPRARLSPHRRLMRGSWISLFAMLMIFIGPLISQAMPMDHHASMSMTMDMPNCHGEPAQHSKAPDEHHVLWEKCGYCSLLFSCPALPGTPNLSLHTAPKLSRYLAANPRLGHARQPVFLGARSRAPPALH